MDNFLIFKKKNMLCILIINTSVRHMFLSTHVFVKKEKQNEPVHDKTYNKTCAGSEDSDQPVHLHMLIILHWSHVPSIAS